MPPNSVSSAASHPVSSAYGGLASSDENGRTDPNVERDFALPWEKYGANAQPVYGLLATYTVNSKIVP